MLHLDHLPSHLVWVPLFHWIRKNKLRVRVSSTDSVVVFCGDAAEQVSVYLNNVHITLGK